MTIERLEREIRLLKTYAVVTTILIVAALFAVPGVAQSQRQRFTEIDVERINVVEPDGRIALSIANTQRVPGPIIDGKELPRVLSQGRIGSAGIIFWHQSRRPGLHRPNPPGTPEPELRSSNIEPNPNPNREARTEQRER